MLTIFPRPRLTFPFSIRNLYVAFPECDPHPRLALSSSVLHSNSDRKRGKCYPRSHSFCVKSIAAGFGRITGQFPAPLRGSHRISRRRSARFHPFQKGFLAAAGQWDFPSTFKLQQGPFSLVDPLYAIEVHQVGMVYPIKRQIL